MTTERPADPFLDGCHDLVGGDPATMGPWQLELLVTLGLREDATLLDLGCGTLRGGLHFIRFLAPRGYHGVDPHADLLAQGIALVARAGLEDKAPELFALDALDGRGTRYDWVLTQSVLNHMDEPAIVATVDRVARVLAAHGRWVSTIRFDSTIARVEPGQPHGRRPREYWRSLANPEWLRHVLAERGLELRPVHEPRHPRGMDVFIATRCAL